MSGELRGLIDRVLRDGVPPGLRLEIGELIRTGTTPYALMRGVASALVGRLVAAALEAEMHAAYEVLSCRHGPRAYDAAFWIDALNRNDWLTLRAAPEVPQPGPWFTHDEEGPPC